MTKSQAKPAIAAVNELFSKSPDGLREIVRAVMPEMRSLPLGDLVCHLRADERSDVAIEVRSV